NARYTPHPATREQTTFPTRRSSDLEIQGDDMMRRLPGRQQLRGERTGEAVHPGECCRRHHLAHQVAADDAGAAACLVNQGRVVRSEEHTSELQSLRQLVCRLRLGKN